MMRTTVRVKKGVINGLCQIKSWRFVGGGVSCATSGRRKRTILGNLMLRLEEAPVPYRLHMIENSILFLKEIFFCPTTLPAIAPVRDQPAEAISIHLERWCKTYDKVWIGHFVLVHICVQETQVASDCKQEVIVPRR